LLGVVVTSGMVCSAMLGNIDKFGRSAALTQEDETLRCALRSLVQDVTGTSQHRKEVVSKVWLLIAHPDNDEIKRRIGLYQKDDKNKATVWMSAARHLNKEVLELLVPYLNQDAKDLALLNASRDKTSAFPQLQESALFQLQLSVLCILLKLKAQGEVVACWLDLEGDQAAAKRIRAAMVQSRVDSTETEEKKDLQ
jgi:hypothetical protein